MPSVVGGAKASIWSCPDKYVVKLKTNFSTFDILYICSIQYIHTIYLF
jgi:hypothetical protein